MGGGGGISPRCVTVSVIFSNIIAFPAHRLVAITMHIFVFPILKYSIWPEDILSNNNLLYVSILLFKIITLLASAISSGKDVGKGELLFTLVKLQTGGDTLKVSVENS